MNKIVWSDSLFHRCRVKCAWRGETWTVNQITCLLPVSEFLDENVFLSVGQFRISPRVLSCISLGGGLTCIFSEDWIAARAWRETRASFHISAGLLFRWPGAISCLHVCQRQHSFAHHWQAPFEKRKKKKNMNWILGQLSCPGRRPLPWAWLKYPEWWL